MAVKNYWVKISDEIVQVGYICRRCRLGPPPPLMSSITSEMLLLIVECFNVKTGYRKFDMHLCICRLSETSPLNWHHENIMEFLGFSHLKLLQCTWACYRVWKRGKNGNGHQRTCQGYSFTVYWVQNLAFGWIYKPSTLYRAVPENSMLVRLDGRPGLYWEWDTEWQYFSNWFWADIDCSSRAHQHPTRRARL